MSPFHCKKINNNRSKSTKYRPCYIMNISDSEIIHVIMDISDIVHVIMDINDSDMVHVIMDISDSDIVHIIMDISDSDISDSDISDSDIAYFGPLTFLRPNIYIYIYFIWILPLYNGGNHHRGNSGCVLKAMYNAI